MYYSVDGTIQREVWRRNVQLEWRSHVTLFGDEGIKHDRREKSHQVQVLRSRQRYQLLLTGVGPIICDNDNYDSNRRKYDTLFNTIVKCDEFFSSHLRISQVFLSIASNIDMYR